MRGFFGLTLYRVALKGSSLGHVAWGAMFSPHIHTTWEEPFNCSPVTVRDGVIGARVFMGPRQPQPEPTHAPLLIGFKPLGAEHRGAFCTF